MKKLFSCKLLSMLLALTLLFAGAVSLKPTQKVNADALVWKYFWQEVFEDLELDGSGHICLIIDYGLLLRDESYSPYELEIDSDTTLVDLNDLDCIQGLALALGEKIGMAFGGIDIVDTTEVISEINMDIVLRTSLTSYVSVNILTGESGGVSSPEGLEAITSTDEDSTIYAVGGTIERGRFYTLLTNLYYNGNYARYSYHALSINHNPNGLPIELVHISL